ncbi:MAG: hypothetical protein ACYC1Y_01420 [Minisyncoccota bacterium]
MQMMQGLGIGSKVTISTRYKGKPIPMGELKAVTEAVSAAFLLVVGAQVMADVSIETPPVGTGMEIILNVENVPFVYSTHAQLAIWLALEARGLNPRSQWETVKVSC